MNREDIRKAMLANCKTVIDTKNSVLYPGKESISINTERLEYIDASSVANSAILEILKEIKYSFSKSTLEGEEKITQLIRHFSV